MSRIVHISKSKYRMVVSDVLPYERPVFFSNRFFARFLKYYGVQTRDGQLVATNHKTAGVEEFLKILGGLNGDHRPCFQYEISRGDNDKSRWLSIIHPYHQVKMVEFYHNYKTLLIDFCCRSHFSLRHPAKISDKQEQFRGYLHLISDTNRDTNQETSLRHFFTYKHCDNINDFYDDYKYLRAEKQFAYLLKLDLSNCFESIIIDDLSKATFGIGMEDCAGSFVQKFADLQRSFLNKKGGIVIGPEFSRIYAEIILQRLDLDVEELVSKDGYVRNRDYKFFRYVDDGFLFYNVKDFGRIWCNAYSKALKQYNLKINKDKLRFFEKRPFVDALTTIKSQLTQLVDETFTSRLSTFKGYIKVQKGQFDTPTVIDYRKFVTSVRTILQSEVNFEKTLKNSNESIITSEVTYEKITSFLLGLMKKHLYNSLKLFNDVYREYVAGDKMCVIDDKGMEIKKRYEREFLSFLQELVEILFFILSCDLRMVTSIKVVSIINLLQLYIRGFYNLGSGLYSCKFPHYIINALDETITDETKTLLRIGSTKPNTMMAVLNVLELQKMMSANTCVTETNLVQYIESQKLSQMHLNFFTVFELIHFMNHVSIRYEWLRTELNLWIEDKIAILTRSGESDTEAVLTCVEVLCDPQTDDKTKMYILGRLGLDKDKMVTTLHFINKQNDLFVKWRGYKVDQEIMQFDNNNVY